MRKVVNGLKAEFLTTKTLNRLSPYWRLRGIFSKKLPGSAAREYPECLRA